MAQRSYKFRFYPTKEQQKQLSIEFGCARWAWNHSLGLRQYAYKFGKDSRNYVSDSKHLTQLKRAEGYNWLKDATANALTQKIIDLDTAYSNFFAGRAKFPKFKKKSHAQSVRYQMDQRGIERTYKPGELLKLPKLGAVKIIWSRRPIGKPKMVTVSKDCTGKYWVAMSIDEPIQLLQKTNKKVGIDLGIKDVVVTSDGFHSGAPKYTKAYAARLGAAQKHLSRKQKGSVRWHKQRVKVARVHAKITDSRKDFMHKLTTKLVREYDFIALEDLHVKGMVKNHCLAKAVSDASMSEIRRQLEYKAGWYGKTVQVISRWEPTSKACSDCGQLHDMPLSKREMDCSCGLRMDRDRNAAINILSAGNVDYTRGEISSGSRVYSITKLNSVKRENKKPAVGLSGTGRKLASA